MLSENDQKHFTICIAGINIRINTLYSRTYWLCKDYLCNNNPDLEISVSKSDLKEEQLLSTGNVSRYMGGYLEPNVVHRAIVEQVIHFDTIMIHGAAISVDHLGYIFSGKSGVGKTTHITKWLNQNPKTFVVNGDKPLVRLINDSFYVCGTPWAGKEHMNSNIMVPLKSIIFMTRSEKNSIKQISFSQAFPRMLSQIYLHKDKKNLQKEIDLIEQMSKQIRFYDFFSNNCEENSYQVAYDVLTQE